MNPKFEVIECAEPKDFFGDCTISYDNWIDEPCSPFETVAKLKMFVEAYNLATGVNSDNLCQPPRVGYDYEKDTHFFLFKYLNNGATVIIKCI